ncbi:hypothetical protein F2Q69_00042515 [Brassica cretica]|uniref:Fcf2 pre-rRNA processing C-terminal domain-containing protein n=1 Tax=Brassica cretica TaxID=69181 RepID=A0A8S9NG14_BRACR|nr:hypothetical protein F2Q69_00042515 [Brassica cretica]
MHAPTMTPELKRDLQLLKLRDVMDPKKHYKRVASQSNLAGKKRKVREIEEKNISNQDKKWKRK